MGSYEWIILLLLFLGLLIWERVNIRRAIRRARDEAVLPAPDIKT